MFCEEHKIVHVGVEKTLMLSQPTYSGSTLLWRSYIHAEICDCSVNKSGNSSLHLRAKGGVAIVPPSVHISFAGVRITYTQYILGNYSYISFADKYKFPCDLGWRALLKIFVSEIRQNHATFCRTVTIVKP